MVPMLAIHMGQKPKGKTLNNYRRDYMSENKKKSLVAHMNFIHNYSTCSPPKKNPTKPNLSAAASLVRCFPGLSSLSQPSLKHLLGQCLEPVQEPAQKVLHLKKRFWAYLTSSNSHLAFTLLGTIF